MDSRLDHTVAKEVQFKIRKIIYWSDSKTVFGWIRSDERKFKTFVSHIELEKLANLCNTKTRIGFQLMKMFQHALVDWAKVSKMQ